MDNQQRRCVDLVLLGKNIFITGSGGCGKSFLLNHIFTMLKEEKRVSITALTGCAAILLHTHARTLHSWAGIGLGKEDCSSLVSKIMKNKNAWKRWKETDVLIIDEASMLGPILFEKLDQIGRKIRRHKDKLFGGIQLIVAGDFFQLPPVEEKQFLFQSETFKSGFDEIIELSTIYRQKMDLAWYQILQNVRRGILTQNDLLALYERIVGNDQIESKMCILYPVNRKVEDLNRYELEKLGQRIYTYQCQVQKDAQVSDFDIENFRTNTGIPEILELAKGALIILTWNVDIANGLVNGSQGVIVDFDVNNYPIIRFINHKKKITIVPFEYTNDVEQDRGKISLFQLPLKLAWALSIHKVQGHNLDCALMDLGSTIFECGQIYVALSRIRSLKGVHLSSFDPEKIKINEAVASFYESLKNDPEYDLN